MREGAQKRRMDGVGVQKRKTDGGGIAEKEDGLRECKTGGQMEEGQGIENSLTRKTCCMVYLDRIIRFIKRKLLVSDS